MVENASLIEDVKEQEIFAGSEKYKNFKTHNDVLANTPVADKIALCFDVEKKAKAYDERISETYIHRGYKNPSGVVAVTSESMSTSDVVRLYDVDNNGFKFIVPNSSTANYGTYYYFAIG